MATSTKLDSRIPQVVAQLPAKAALGAHQAAERIADDARVRAPEGDPIEDKHPGRLKASIETYDQPEGTYVVVRARAGKDQYDESGAPYGHFVEFGTSKMPPHPFLVPAAQENEAEFVVHVGKQFRTL